MDEEEHSHRENDTNLNDPIVKEIPVFLSKRLEDQLYLFQYPLRPISSQDPLNVKRCFVKPRNQAVKLEVQLNTNSSNFNVNKAEDVALRIDGPPEYRKKEKEVVFKDNLLDKVEYVSSKVVDNVDRYGIGVFNGQEYHITPLKGLLRLKPYYPHLDREIKKKAEAKQKEEAGPSSSTAKQVTVKFSQGGDNDKWKKLQENSYKALMERQAEEAWVECDWQPEKSELSDLERMKLYVEDNRQCASSKDEKDQDVVEYLRKLVPEDKEQAIIFPSLPSNVVSFSSLRALPLLEQCKLLLKDAKIMTFQQLLMLLAGCEGLTNESLLKTLSQIAVLVRGNWVVKSDILYPDDSFSAISGVPAEIMCRARDYILILFTKNQYVERRKVSSVIKVPSEEIKEIFTGISKLRYNKGWELSLSVDIEFINKYPDIVHRQNSLWEMREVQLSDYFKDNVNKDRKRRKSKSISEDSVKIPKKDGQTSVRDNVNQDEIGNEKIKRTKTLKCDDINHKDEKL